MDTYLFRIAVLFENACSYSALAGHEEEAETDFREFDWQKIEDRLHTAHRILGTAWSVNTAREILGVTDNAEIDSIAIALRREVSVHIEALTFWANHWITTR